MRFARFERNGVEGLAVAQGDDQFFGVMVNDPEWPGSLSDLVGMGSEPLKKAGQKLFSSRKIDLGTARLLPPLPRPGKIICVGLNYADHAAESGFQTPEYPTIFARFSSSLIGADAPIIRPAVSEQLDYEGEIVAIVGRRGRNIRKEDALAYIIGYSLFNDASVRDYQFKAPQWTMGKNFDGTGAFGPWLTTVEELPEGCADLILETRLNGQVVQHASTNDLVFGVAELVAILSEALTLEPGDLIVTGTPNGVGLARKPPLWMKPGDICEVEATGLGLLRNPIAAAS
jgi:acylpyruvate hydrolase